MRFLSLCFPLPGLMLLLCVSLTAQSPSSVPTVSSPPRSELKLDQPVHGSIATGEVHRFTVNLTAGQFLRVEVEQGRVPIVVRLLSAAGKTFVERQNPEQNPSVSLSFISQEDGSYGVEVRLDEKMPSPKGYDIHVTQLRPLEPDDEKRIQAESDLADGDTLLAKGTGSSRHDAIPRYEAALALCSDLKDQEGQANALAGIGNSYYFLGELNKALDAWNRELLLLQELGNSDEQRSVLGDIGGAYRRMGQPAKALEYLSQGLEKHRAAGDKVSEGFTLTEMGSAYYALGDVQKALELYQQALPLNHESGNLSAEAANIGNIGSVYFAIGEPQKALEYYHRGLKLEEAAQDLGGQGAAETTLASVYSQIGEWELALEAQKKALELFKESGDQGLEAVALNSIGATYRALGEPEKALEYHQRALPILHGANLPYEATALQNIGLAYRDLGQFPKAIECYEQALALLEKRGNRRVAAQVLNYMGDASFKMGDAHKSVEYWERALPGAHDAGDRVVEASILTGIARAQFEVGNLGEAQTRLDAALAMTDAIRTAWIGPDMSSFYASTVRDRYELQIELLMQRHQEAAAFEASEQARARSLLQLLSESHADIREGVDPALLERERALQAALRVKSEQRIRTQNAALQKDIDDLAAQYREVEAQIRSSSPRYAALTQPQPLHLAEIQKQVLDPDTLLLEYALGEKRSFLWAVTPDSFASYELPGRPQLEALARQAYGNLSIRQPETSERDRSSTLSLSRALLAPVAAQLGNKRLVVVAEGGLQYVPFAALPAPMAKGRPLMADHEIVNLPSASTIAVLRQQIEGRKPAPRMVAVLADPVFDRNDPRVRHAGRVTADEPPEAENLERSAKDAGVVHFDRLLASRREADTIVALAGKTSSLKAVDFEASRQLATSNDLGQYRFIHVATHGLLNSRTPELSGLVFSLVDRDGKPQNGFVEAQEIYNLKLGADLVVLSACETALGKEIRGEGLVGLTRGFMYAGVPRVVASLWKVPDQATTELMQKFYQGILQQGLQPAGALRAAQYAMWKETRRSAPYYWAGFTLQGEWK